MDRPWYRPLNKVAIAEEHAWGRVPADELHEVHPFDLTVDDDVCLSGQAAPSPNGRAT